MAILTRCYKQLLNSANRIYIFKYVVLGVVEASMESIFHFLLNNNTNTYTPLSLNQWALAETGLGNVHYTTIIGMCAALNYKVRFLNIDMSI